MIPLIGAINSFSRCGDVPTNDPFADDVVLHLKGDGDNGSTNFIDETCETVISGGNVEISTAESKYGGSSIYFSGANKQYLLFLNNSLTFPSDFTIEAWVNLTQYNSGTINYKHVILVLASNNSNVLAAFNIGGESNVLQFGQFGGVTVKGSTTVSLNTWHHVAVSRKGSTVNLFLDGVLDGSDSIGTAFNTISQGHTGWGDALDSGDESARRFRGYIDSFRVTSGVARYDTNFDPETDTYLN